MLLLADAQTSGGLLFGAEPGAGAGGGRGAGGGGVPAAVIGEVRAGTGRIALR